MAKVILVYNIYVIIIYIIIYMSDVFYDFNIGTIFAVFMLSGNTTVSKDLLNIFVSGCIITSIHF